MSTSLSMSQSKRRASGPNRVIQAVYEPYALLLSPSPLIRIPDDYVARKKAIVRATTAQSQQDSSTKAHDGHEINPEMDLGLRIRRITEIGTVPAQLIFDFLGDSLRDVVQAASTCRLFRDVSNSSVTSIELIPNLGSCDSFSRTEGMNSLAACLKPYLRGQHISSLSIVNGKHCLTLPNHQRGPHISAMSLHKIIRNMPNLVRIDVRGVDLRDYATWKDHFLSDLGRLTPQLKSLKVGGAFLRNWEPQWWSKLHHLTDFVVGSRREDNDWHEPLVSIQLYDDFFQMLRSHKWHSVKVWVMLTSSSVSQLLMPTIAIPDLMHLSVNLSGSAATLRVTDDVPVADASTIDKKKPDPKASAKKPEEQGQGRFLFPTLATVCLADVSDRPEVATDLLQRFLLTAPNFHALNIVNTHRNAPGRVPAPQKGRWAGSS